MKSDAYRYVYLYIWGILYVFDVAKFIVARFTTGVRVGSHPGSFFLRTTGARVDLAIIPRHRASLRRVQLALL